jgi:hypothetical protein
MSDWKFWDWLAYGVLFIAAAIIAADTGLKLSPELAHQLPLFLESAWWGFSPLGLFVIGTIVLILRALGLVGADKAKKLQSPWVKWPDPYSPIIISGKQI